MKRLFAILLLTLFAIAPALASSAAATTDDLYREHVDYLRTNLPSGFVVVEAAPWVVIGNGPPEAVRAHAKDTVAWAHKKLKQAYFESDPGIVDIWLFADADSYQKNVVAMLGEPPGTPYGFANERGIFMNISTGSGTLVHEMVHPFLRANFPSAPPWFNEGLASLYEQSGDRDGAIHGFTNWRLDGLHLAIAAQRVPEFAEFMAQTRQEFYTRDPGTNYAQARYLCYYLQQKGLLRKYYDHLRAHITQDPTGIDSLRAVLGDNAKDFKDRWEAYTLLLTFPEG